MPCRNLRFLVVEDHEFQRHALVRLLRTLGAEAVHSAEDGRAALQVIRDPDRPVDIVISDLSMPGMDGLEFVRHLSESGARVSLILASALEAPLLLSIANMARAYKVRLLGVVGKPAAAVKLQPLIELHRQQQAESGSEDSAFGLAEIADAWAHGEFEAWFEPRVRLNTGAVVAMDAKPRWRHPTRGLLEPADFMPSMAARGLQDDFAWLVLQKCVAQCRAWRGAGLDLAVAAPLLFSSLTDTQMAARIRQIAANEEVEPRHLVLGVREDALNTGQARALENLARLRVEGFGLAIDDFGSGPMEIERLAMVAFTEVKILSTFVSGAHRDEGVRAGLAVGLEMAQQLKLRAIAAGISSKDEWELLHDWGCEQGQGPFIAEAMPAQAVESWLPRWQGTTIR